MPSIYKIATLTALIYLAYCCLLFLCQRQLIFPRYAIEVPPDRSQSIAGLERVWLEIGGDKVETWYLAPPDGFNKGPAPALIFAHGNAEIIDFCLDELDIFTRFGMGVMLVEYPGYGRSEGTPSQKSITNTLVAAYNLLASNKNIDNSRIVFYGRSLGGGAACALGSERPPAALILSSTFTSVRSFATRYLTPGFLVRDPFDNLSFVRSYDGPILIIHGKYDEMIPYRHGVALHKAAQNSRLVTYECGHNDCPSSWATFRQDVETFLNEAGIIGPSIN
ncbi:alpha/beta hydrolase [Thermodesulfobacteriota bacterium]